MPRVVVLLVFVFLAASSLRSQAPSLSAETMASFDMLRDANVNADTAARLGSVTVLLTIERDSDGDGDAAPTESRRIVQSLWSGHKLRLEVHECEGLRTRGKLIEVIANDGEAAYVGRPGENATVMVGGAARSPYSSVGVRPRPGAFWGLLDLPDSANLSRDLGLMVECNVSIDASGRLTIIGTGERGHPEWELAYRYVFDLTQGCRPVAAEGRGPVVSSTGIDAYSLHAFDASFRDGCPWPERIAFRTSYVRARDGKATEACASWERIELTRLAYSSDPEIPANAFSLAGLNLPPGTVVLDLLQQRSYRSEAPAADEQVLDGIVQDVINSQELKGEPEESQVRDAPGEAGDALREKRAAPAAPGALNAVGGGRASLRRLSPTAVVLLGLAGVSLGAVAVAGGIRARRGRSSGRSGGGKS